MSAQALKMKHNLEKIKKEREVFEEKKRQLDAEMTKGRINMGKIKKGLKNNEIVDSPMDVSGSPNETQNMQNTLPIAKQLLISKKSKAFLVADLSSKSNNGGNLTSRPLSGPPAGLGKEQNMICILNSFSINDTLSELRDYAELRTGGYLMYSLCLKIRRE